MGNSVLSSRVNTLAKRRKQRAVSVHLFLSKYQTRVALTVLILLSLAPFQFVDSLWWCFFLIFGVEFAARSYVLRLSSREATSARQRLVERVLLVLDLVALGSFLPPVQMGVAKFLRLARFSRLLLLLGYWGQTFKTLWHILNREERTKQLKLLAATAVVFTFVAAALVAEFGGTESLRHMGLQPDARFADFVWWSFRQIQDPGNLITDPHQLGLVVLSAIMTTVGLFMLSFLVGLGTSVVAELIQTTREQPVGFRGHSVLLNVREHSHFFLDQAADHNSKQVRAPLWVALGADINHLELLANPRYRRFRYRQGNPYYPEDLAKVDVHRARRVVVLADRTLADPDPDTVAAVLSVRRANPEAEIYAEVLEEKNTAAILCAGGPTNTMVVATEHLIGLVLANLIAKPGSYPIMEDLFTVRGSEIYSVILERDTRSLPPYPASDRYQQLFFEAYKEHRCILIGLAVPYRPDSISGPRSFQIQFAPQSPAARVGAGRLKGLVAIAQTQEAVHRLSEDWDDLSSRTRSTDVPSELPKLLPVRQDDEQVTALVCGFHANTGLVLEHLIRFKPSARIVVMVPSEDARRAAQKNLIALGHSLIEYANTEIFDPGPRGRFQPSGEADFVLGYRAPDSVELVGRVELIVGDWAHRTELLRATEEGQVLNAEVIFIHSDTSSKGDPDARGVLTLMKLVDLYGSRRFADCFHPDVRVVIEVTDPLKAELLEERFSAGDRTLPVTVVPTQRLRHALLFQSTVVPGFSTVFSRLFSQQSPNLHRLDVDQSSSTETVYFSEMLRSLFVQLNLVLVGLEFVDESGSTQIIVGPVTDDEGATLRRRDIRALYVFGDLDRQRLEQLDAGDDSQSRPD